MIFTAFTPPAIACRAGVPEKTGCSAGQLNIRLSLTAAKILTACISLVKATGRHGQGGLRSLADAGELRGGHLDGGGILCVGDAQPAMHSSAEFMP